MTIYHWTRPAPGAGGAGAGASARTDLVRELFGLTEDRFTDIPVLDAVPLGRAGITYVTGFSGTGKSKLLELFLRDNPDAWVPEEPEDDRPLIELFDLELPDVLALLGRVGLGEAFVFLTPYRRLSDGQRARARLALAYAKGKELLVVDEFLSTVDRTTAAIVAYGFQKFCRRNGISAVVATAHEDLAEALAPDVRITLDHNGSKVVEERPVPAPARPFAGRIVVERGTVEDYEALSRFHYMGGLEVPESAYDIDVHVVRVNGIVAGVHVTSAAYPRSWARHAVFAEVNEHLTISRRTVVHPTFRGIGIAAVLSDPELARRDRVFGRSALQRFQPFMLGAGYEPVDVAENRPTALSAAADDLVRRLDAGDLPEDERDRATTVLRDRAVELLVLEYEQYRELAGLDPVGDRDAAAVRRWFTRCVEVLDTDGLVAAVRAFPMAGFLGVKDSARVLSGVGRP
ncbi:hypothetical protein [Saccharothrix xinjiangensis]|uniref:Uncharacterized protein n=1 Tax=Saccharothrix xinjiangensis TaxID=204798 RepID=A0ABV9YFA6_9PSEU